MKIKVGAKAPKITIGAKAKNVNVGGKKKGGGFVKDKKKAC